MTRDTILAEVLSMLRPEPDEDGFVPREYPCPDLLGDYGVEAKYLHTSVPEGWAAHEHSLLVPQGSVEIAQLSRLGTIPFALFDAALRLVADGMDNRAQDSENATDYRYLPPALLSFWSGFESIVRLQSQLMLETCSGVPPEIDDFLREQERRSDKNGDIKLGQRYTPVLDRYAIFLRYGYGYSVDRGSRFWQRLGAAREMRDYFTHIKVAEPRAVTSTQVLEFMEAVVIALIIPACEIGRSVFLGAFLIYNAIRFLVSVDNGFIERPFFTDWMWEKESYGTHLNFTSVDTKRFLTTRQYLELEMKARKDGRDVR